VLLSVPASASTTLPRTFNIFGAAKTSKAAVRSDLPSELEI